MARIVLGTYLVRFPVGGYLGWHLQWLNGLRRLGHDVVLVERADEHEACFDPITMTAGDDCATGIQAVDELMRNAGLAGCWSFRDVHGVHHGLDASEVDHLFATADLYVDMGAHGAWAEHAAQAAVRILVDGEPGYTQMKLETAESPPDYDHWYTNGANIGTARSSAPTAGRAWRHVFNPVDLDLFREPGPPGPAYTTVMSWQAHEPICWRGTSYGQKDVEFERFLDLPRRTPATLEVAVTGKRTPHERLRAHGWRVRDAVHETVTYDAWLRYLTSSRGEFGVCKNVFVATRSGWFSDRSAAYLACGRPVVLQDTGFSDHLPCGEGLFAVDDADQAAAAIAEIEGDWARHSRAAQEIAREHLAAPRVLGQLLAEIGVS